MALYNRERDFTEATITTIRNNLMGDVDEYTEFRNFIVEYGNAFDTTDYHAALLQLDKFVSEMRCFMSEIVPKELERMEIDVRAADEKFSMQCINTTKRIQEYGKMTSFLSEIVSRPDFVTLLSTLGTIGDFGHEPNVSLRDLIIMILKEKGAKDAEIELFFKYPFAAWDVWECKGLAERVELILFGMVEDGSQENAFRHSFWNALMVLWIGERKAKLFADAHETQNENVTMTDGLQADRAMDLHNNAVGRSIGQQVKNMAIGEINQELYDRLGGAEKINEAMQEYGFVNAYELLIFLRIADAYREAVPCKFENGNLVSLNGQSIDGKLVFLAI